MEGTTDLDFSTVVGGTFYIGLLIISAGTATILTIWIKITSSRCQLPNTDDIGIRTTRNLDSILLNIFLVMLIIVNLILFNKYYKGYFLRSVLTSLSTHKFGFWISTLFNSFFQSFDGKTWWIPCLVRPLFWSNTATNARCSSSCN